MSVQCACPDQRCLGWIDRGWQCPELDDDMVQAIRLSLHLRREEEEYDLAIEMSEGSATHRFSPMRCAHAHDTRQRHRAFLPAPPRSRSPEAAKRCLSRQGEEASSRQHSGLGVGHECMICQETRRDGVEPSGCLAPQGRRHFICAECVVQYVTSELDVAERSDRRLEERRRCGGRLRCPAKPEGCPGHMADSDLERVLPSEVLRRYRTMKQADEEHRQWSENHEAETDPEVLREGLLRLMPNAKQCLQCGTGPIDHFACSDLGTHHGERVGNTQVKNECPKCRWWAWDISEWPAWDGILRV